MKKKKSEKKMQENMEWATAQIFFFLSHNTTNYIVTSQVGRQRAGTNHDTTQQATKRPLLGHDMARRPAIRSGGRCDKAHSASGWEQGRDTKICIMAEGATLGRDTTTLRYDTAQ